MRTLFKWKQLSFRSKLLLSNLVVVLVLALSFTLYFIFFIMDSELEKSLKNLNMLSTKIAEQVDSLVYNMDKTALQVASNPYIVQQFQNLPDVRGNHFTSEPLYTRELERYINSYNFKKNATARICIYNDKEDFVYSGVRLTTPAAIDSYFTGQDFADIQRYFSADTSALSYYIPPRDDPFSYPNERFDDLSLFSVVRAIKSYAVFAEAPVGYVEVQHPITRLAQLFDTLDSSIFAFIIDTDGATIYQTLPDSQPPPNATSLLQESFAQRTEQSAVIDRLLVSVVPMQELGQVVLLVQPQQQALASLTSFWGLLLVSVVLFLCVITVTEYMIASRLTKPLTALQRSVEAVNIDHMAWALLPDSSDDDLLRLNTAFERMLLKLQSSIDELVEVRTGVLKSQLQALQAQMNPHFLHNLLTIMDMAAQDGNTDSVHHICSTLSSMLRYTTSYKESQSLLRNELEHAVNYLELMKVRYEERFDYTITHDSAAPSVSVPKLILQPLTENCFQHGFKGTRPPWRIQIAAQCDETHWRLSVTDNGCGFAPEELARWQEFTAQLTLENAREQIAQLQIGGLCLANIYLRLYLLYGDDIIFEIRQPAAGGTQITIGGRQDD